MKYDANAEFREILRRGGEIKRKKEQRTTRILTGTSVGLFALLMISVYRIAGSIRPEEGVRTAYGAFFLPSGIGGYVIAAVLAFALGVTVTLLCIRHRKQKEDTNDEAPDD